MNKVMIVTEKFDQWKQIKKQCQQEDFLFYCYPPGEVSRELEKQKVQLVVLDLEEIASLVKWLKAHESTSEIPILWVATRQKMDSSKLDSQISDFIFSPMDTEEFCCRVRRLLWQKQNVKLDQCLQANGLTIDFVKYEVRLQGELVNLTYKEYELLKFLASNKGKVFTREAILNKVWGYDYFGGTRTVDVHIRRLRSKIEDADHTFIETVRNIGYRFKE